ncbi:MAG: H-NS histone family protein [Betaproteobacteria bacterium]|nr:MAG: H-NS histone family protein [Betaproteobacteria bacterium]
MATLQELLAQKAALEKQIDEARREDRAAAIAQVKALMAQHGLSAADLVSKAAPARSAGKSTGKVAAKFRNQETGETWSGRGLKPKWLTAALAAGRSLSDFEI